MRAVINIKIMATAFFVMGKIVPKKTEQFIILIRHSPRGESALIEYNKQMNAWNL